ncbi:hypothetical protein CB1_000610010 [Camelus ferus]|nr:hypothetical protein CB1_000610010 [Camelus ferus]
MSPKTSPGVTPPGGHFSFTTLRLPGSYGTDVTLLGKGQSSVATTDGAFSSRQRGFTTQQAEIIVSALVKIMEANMDLVYKDMVTKMQQEITLQQVMSQIANVKKDMIILEKSEFSALRSENEDEVVKVRTDTKLDFSLEKSRVKELHAQQDRAITQTDRKIDTEVAGLKTMLESHKLDNIKYLAVCSCHQRISDCRTLARGHGRHCQPQVEPGHPQLNMLRAVSFWSSWTFRRGPFDIHLYLSLLPVQEAKKFLTAALICVSWIAGHGKTPKDAASVRATHPIPAACGIYYFEVKIVSKGRDGYMGIGLSAQGVNMNRLPGIAFTDLPPNLYPTVGLQTPGEVVDANFGQHPFVFDIEDYMREWRTKIQAQIDRFPIGDREGEWQTMIQKLHGSTINSANAKVISERVRQFIEMVNGTDSEVRCLGGRSPKSQDSYPVSPRPFSSPSMSPSHGMNIHNLASGKGSTAHFSGFESCSNGVISNKAHQSYCHSKHQSSSLNVPELNSINVSRSQQVNNFTSGVTGTHPGLCSVVFLPQQTRADGRIIAICYLSSLLCGTVCFCTRSAVVKQRR